MKSFAALVVTALLLYGCAIAPEVYKFESSRTYERSYDDVWEDIVAFFAKNHIQIKTEVPPVFWTGC